MQEDHESLPGNGALLHGFDVGGTADGLSCEGVFVKKQLDFFHVLALQYRYSRISKRGEFKPEVDPIRLHFLQHLLQPVLLLRPLADVSQLLQVVLDVEVLHLVQGDLSVVEISLGYILDLNPMSRLQTRVA